VLASAAVDLAEIEVENVVRDLQGAVARVDRANPELGALEAVFPGGFGPVIDPEGAAQLEPVARLRVRLAPFAGRPEVVADRGRLDVAEERLRGLLATEEAATERVDVLDAEAALARRRLREQLESAYGRLRDYYRASPGHAERFFRRGPRSRRPAPEAPPA
jgi:hypothetical protein